MQGIKQFAFLGLAQHAVEIHVVKLKIKVSGNKTGEIVVVVVFIHLEQLVVGVGHDGEALFREHIRELLVGILNLEAVYQVVNQWFTVDKVLLLKLIFSSLEFCHEGLFLLGEVILRSLFPFKVSHLFKLPSAPHRIIIPRGLIEYRPQIGHRKSISLTGVECIA